MRRFFIAILIVGVIAMVALAGCGGGGSSSGGNLNPGDNDNNNNNDIILTGRVIAQDNIQGVEGVTVVFGTNPVATDTTDENGNFTLNLQGRSPAEVLGGDQYFSINTSSVPGGGYPNDQAVAYQSSIYFVAQNRLKVPTEIFGGTKDLGTIKIQSNMNSDPPPPPAYSEGYEIPEGYYP